MLSSSTLFKAPAIKEMEISNKISKTFHDYMTKLVTEMKISNEIRKTFHDYMVELVTESAIATKWVNNDSLRAYFNTIQHCTSFLEFQELIAKHFFPIMEPLSTTSISLDATLALMAFLPGPTDFSHTVTSIMLRIHEIGEIEDRLKTIETKLSETKEEISKPISELRYTKKLRSKEHDFLQAMLPYLIPLARAQLQAEEKPEHRIKPSDSAPISLTIGTPSTTTRNKPF